MPNIELNANSKVVHYKGLLRIDEEIPEEQEETIFRFYHQDGSLALSFVQRWSPENIAAINQRILLSSNHKCYLYYESPAVFVIIKADLEKEGNCCENIYNSEMPLQIIFVKELIKKMDRDKND